MAYITANDLAQYLEDKNFANGEVSNDDAVRLLAVAIGEWERLVGVVPFQSSSVTKTFDPRDIQSDRRGWILDLATPLSAVPTLVKSGVETGNAGQTLVQYTDWQMPDTSNPWTQIIFNTYPLNRLEITGMFGYMISSNINAEINDALYYLASARIMEENDGKQGRVSRVKTGLVEMSMPDDSSEIFRKRARDIARKYRLS